MAFITGQSGAGKSTLLKLIMLMERPTIGRIIIAGKVLKTSNSASAFLPPPRRRGIPEPSTTF